MANSSATLLDFLQNARFPCPPIQMQGHPSTTDVSLTDMGLVDETWKAKRAIKDNTLVDHLCDTLQQIIEQTPLPQSNHLLRSNFSPELERNGIWREPNMSEAESTTFLIMGVNLALPLCTTIYDPCLRVACKPERSYGDSLSRVDWVIRVDDVDRILLEAKSPTVMQAIGERLPLFGAHLRWQQGGSLLSKVFLKVAIYLDLRKKEWLFLTCHNSWVVFRLVKVNGDMVLAYSPVLEMANSSLPFQTIFPTDTVLDTLDKDPDEDDTVSEGESDNGSHEYKPTGGGMADGNGTTFPLITRSRRGAGGGDSDSELMLTSSTVYSPDPHWARLHGISVDYSIIPSFSHEWDHRVRISRLLGAGSTDGVYEGSLGGKLFAIKVVEILGPADVPKRQRLRSEFDIYLHLERAHKQLDALIVDLHGGALSDWDDLMLSEREQVFALVKQLHGADVVHGDLEPGNVVRTANGGFLLIDFTESVIHLCPDTDQLDALTLHGPPSSKRVRCHEIRFIRKALRGRQRTP